MQPGSWRDRWTCSRLTARASSMASGRTLTRPVTIIMASSEVETSRRCSSYRPVMVEPKGQGESQGRSISAKVVIWIVVAVIALVLILQNTNETKLHILFWDVTTGLWFLLAIVFVLGFLIGWFLPKLRRNKDDD